MSLPFGVAESPVPLAWWEHDEDAWVAVQKVTAPFFDTPSNEFFVASEDFASSLEQVWAMMEGFA